MARKSNSSTTQIDKTSYFFTMQCGICHPGGGPTQYDRDGRLYWNGTQFGYGGGVTALPTQARLDGDYGFIAPKTMPDGTPAGTPMLATGWQKNGVLEADCLMCHMTGYSWRNRAATMTGGAGMAGVAAFRVAPAMGAGWGSVTVAATPAFPPTASAVGAVNYEAGITAGNLQADASGNLVIPLARVGATPEANCRGCHSTPDTKKSGRTLNDANDVHKAGGVGCTACHPLKGDTSSERMSHQIGKGDAVVGSVRDDLDGTGLSCAQCHLQGASPAPLVAPNPTRAHASIPSLHFDTMACQACHIRYLQDDATIAGIQAPELVIEMTSTGTQTISTWDRYFASVGPAGAPYRWNPALRRYKGKLTTVKPLITAWYGDWVSGTGDGAIIRPIPLRLVRKAMTGGYGQNVARLASLPLTGGGADPANPIPYTKSDIKASLEAMAAAVDTANPDPAAGNDIVVSPVLVRAGKVYFLNGAGEVEYFESAVAESHDFSVNHNVVPRRDPQNPAVSPGPYGAGGCTDCHSSTSSFFFAKQLREPAQYQFLDELGTVVNPEAGQPQFVEHWQAMGYTQFRVAALTGQWHQVYVQIYGSGPGSAVTGEGVDCRSGQGTCTTTLPGGGSLVLTAHPAPGFAPRAWTGCTPSADLSTCTVVASSADGLGQGQVVTVTFGLPDPTPVPQSSGIVLSVVGSGWGTVAGSGLNCTIGTQGACNAELASGTAVTLTATPGPYTWVESWTGCTPAGANQCTVTVSGIANVKLTFSNGTGGGPYSETQALVVRIAGALHGNRVTGPLGLSCLDNGGTCRIDVSTGQSVRLTAAPGPGSTFAGWEGCTSVSGSTCDVTMDAAKAVHASFTP